jgi:hypothetical protein
MTDATDQDPNLQALFAQPADDLAEAPVSDAFTKDVMQQTDRLKRRRIILRVCLALALALLSPPLQDFGLAMAQTLVQSLVDVENRLLAQALAPLNTVGGLLSVVLLILRAAHKRLFT